jgi:hypothetical protein
MPIPGGSRATRKLSFVGRISIDKRARSDGPIADEKPVGSRTGAVFRRFSLAVAPRFLWECLNSQTVNPFPAPATSHPACGFPALGAPVCLVSRVMGPIVLGRLSHRTIDGAGSR